MITFDAKFSETINLIILTIKLSFILPFPSKIQYPFSIHHHQPPQFLHKHITLLLLVATLIPSPSPSFIHFHVGNSVGSQIEPRMQPNKPLDSSQHEHPPPPPPPPPPPSAVVSQPPPQWQQSAMVLAPPCQYQSCNPPMFPTQLPVVLPPHLHHLPPGTASQPPAPNHLYPDHERDWSTGLFQCTSNMKNCFITTLCPCVTFGEIAEILTEGHTPWYEPATLCACLGAASFVFIFMLWLTFPYTCLYRVKMRRKYKLKGHLAEDCAINAFCGWCALCQQYRELDHQGFNVSIGWHENKRRERQAVAIFRLIPPEEQEMTR